ncbi:hypothetical protein BGX31_008658 [Mortierella sp. GBA43]|nr:hypothetical protein BGX31_008658 [Mortierella sp. GBA43]
MFYGKQGPSVIVNVWHEHLPKSNLSKFTNAAVDVVIKQSKPELAKVITNPKLRHPANSTSREQIDGFNSSVILNTLTENDMSQANLGWIDQREKILADDDRRYAYIQHEPKVQLLADDDGTILTICIALKKLTRSALESVRFAAKNQHWFLVYDNINSPNRKFHHRLDHTDIFENGTTATIVTGEDLGNEDPVPNQPTTPTLRDFAPDEGAFYLRDTELHFTKKLVEEYKKALRLFLETRPDNLSFQEFITFAKEEFGIPARSKAKLRDTYSRYAKNDAEGSIKDKMLSSLNDTQKPKYTNILNVI